MKSIGALVLAGALSAIASTSAVAQNHEKQLVVYASHPSEMVDYFIKDFGDKNGVKVTTVKAGTGELLNRIRAERGRPAGDIMWGGFSDTGSSTPDLFDVYRSPGLANVQPKMIDPSGYNTPFGASTMVIMYNKKLVTADQAPKTWADLAKPEWKGKVVHADPSKASSALGALTTWLQIYGKGEPAWKLVEDMTRNMNIVLRSSLVFQQVGRGEYPVGVTYEEGAFNYVLAGTAGIVYPADGTLLQPEGMFIVKGGPNPRAARLFADYLLTSGAQTDLATKFPGRRPTLNGVTTHAEMLAPDKFKVIEYDENWAAQNRKQILDRMQQVIIRTQ